jgi:tetratricopeptide (TPR) repeat protein
MRSIFKPLLLLALVGTVVALPALAQQPPSSYPPPCDASKVSKPDVERAHTVFLSGRQYLDESNYDKAIGYFKDAYSIDCSVHAILPIIATAYERRGDKAEAVRALEEYLRRAPSAPDREVVERRIRNLSDQLAREQPATTATAPAATATATAVPAATVPPEPTSTAPTAATAPQPTGAGGSSAAPWVVVSAGAVATIAGLAIYGVGAGKISSAETACGNKRNGCTQDVASEGNAGRTLEPVGGALAVLGVAAVVGGLIWHFNDKPKPALTGVRLSPAFAPGYAGVALGGAL